jgi:hypothetical protein
VGDYEDYCRFGCGTVYSGRIADVLEEHTASNFNVEN